jgi:hypothetical protein
MFPFTLIWCPILRESSLFPLRILKFFVIEISNFDLLSTNTPLILVYNNFIHVFVIVSLQDPLRFNFEIIIFIIVYHPILKFRFGLIVSQLYYCPDLRLL